MKRILIESTGMQTRIALTENGELLELMYEYETGENIMGNIYVGRVENVLHGMKAAFIDIGLDKNAYMYFEGDNKTFVGSGLKKGQEIIVQVKKEGSDTKGPVVTEKISYPGKFIVLIPNDDKIGVSQKITDQSEKERIKAISKELLPNNYGLIIRTEGIGKSAKDYEDEINALVEKAREIEQKREYIKAPAVLYKDFSPITTAVRELLTYDIDEVILNDLDNYKTMIEICGNYKFNTGKIKYYDSDIPLFNNFYIESQVEKIFHKKIWLKSGGFLVIEQTETCVVIDVNTGKYTGKKDFQDTIMKINSEAAAEIAKQLRLRNLSGMIIVDFISMQREEDNSVLKKILEDAVKKDRIKTIVVGMTELGLMQITRQKKRPPITNRFTMRCTCCKGTGQVPTVEFIVGNIRKDVISIFTQTVFNEVTISSDRGILNTFAGTNGFFVSEIEKKYGCKIIFNEIKTGAFGYYEISRRRV